MLWFVFFAALVTDTDTAVLGARENMPFVSEQACLDYLADDNNYDKEFSYIANQLPNARISFSCASSEELESVMLIEAEEI